MKISNQYYSAEVLGGFEGPAGNDDNVDVEVRLRNGKRYSATFFTVESIHRIMEHYKESGECEGGLYFWCADMIIVRDLSCSTIELTINDLIKTGELESAFAELEELDLTENAEP